MFKTFCDPANCTESVSLELGQLKILNPCSV